MKKILLLILFCTAALYGAPMGKKDKISKSWTITNNYWSCSFIEGAMFPGSFTFADSSSAGGILFRDTAVSNGKEFYLFEERRAAKNIIVNTEKEFIIELTGTYWRNLTPLITPAAGVRVICRYEFQKKSPSVKMIFKYEVSDNANVRFNSFFNIGWYYENPFEKVIADGKTFDMKKGLSFSDKKNIIFENSKFIAEFISDNAFMHVPLRKSIIACSFGSAENIKKRSGFFEKHAVLKLQKR